MTHYALIDALKQVIGAKSFDTSVQVLLPTKDGRLLRVGITDDDGAAALGIWFDYSDLVNLPQSCPCGSCSHCTGHACEETE